MLLNCGIGEDSWETLNCKEIQPVHPKGDQSWIFIGKTDADGEAAVLWPPDVKYWLIWKDSDAGKGWRQEKGLTEDKMVGCYDDWMDMSLGMFKGLVMDRGLVWYSPWGRKELDMTEQLDWTDPYLYFHVVQKSYSSIT